MSSKFTLAVIFALFMFTGVQANKVSLQTAQTVALNFYRLNAPAAKNSAAGSAVLKYTQQGAGNTVYFYVFDIAPKGFVIVTADDNLQPVIAYSTESDFRTDFNGVGVKDWMDNAAKKISSALTQQLQADARIANLWSCYIQGTEPGGEKLNPVAPLLNTTWNQEPFYNQLCPYNSTDNQQCVTGCVATAMAQIMRYYSFPPTGTGSYSYNDAPPSFSNNYGEQSADFGTTTYNWGQMPAAINANNTDVATIMYQCGVAVRMNYGDDKEGGSGAAVLQSEAGGPANACAQRAYTTYFYYDASTLQGVLASNYTTDQWASLLQTELSAGRPVQYEGQDPGVGGHTWVCDGFDNNGMFHMNWGWGGYEDGYFSLGDLTAGGANFSTSEAALIGIQPGTYSTPCNAPTGLTAAVGPTSATLGWAAVSGAAGYNLQYKLSTDAGWTTVANINTASYTLTGLSSCSAYSFQVQTVCSGNTSAYSAAAPFSTLGCLLSYCTSGSTNQSHGYIHSVQLGSINNTVLNGKGYTSYTNLSTNLEQGSANVITLTPGFSGLPYDEYWTVYIDYNQNGQFTDAGETVASVNGNGVVTATINVPPTAATGTTVLRIQMQQGAYQNNPCATFTYGMVQDYMVNIIPSAATGISNVGLAQFKLYPNPAADHISVEYNGMSEGAVHFNIYNLAGQKMMSEESSATAGDNLHQISVDKLTNGIYILEIESNGELNRQKFIVAR